MDHIAIPTITMKYGKNISVSSYVILIQKSYTRSNRSLGDFSAVPPHNGFSDPSTAFSNPAPRLDGCIADD